MYNLISGRILAYTVIIMCMLILSCEEVVNLELPDGEKRVVISGWITNKAESYEIHITETIAFNDQNPNPGISGAEVFVTDRLNVRYDFVEAGNPGVYRSDPNIFVGIPGGAYVLNVILEDGTIYISDQQVLNPVPDLENVSVDFFTDAIQNVPNYFVKGVIVDEPQIRNFYRWKVFVNGSLRNSPDELIVFNDKFTDGNRFENRADNITLEVQDHVVLEHWSLSEGAFQYYELLISQTKSEFGGTNTPPAIVRGNIQNINDEAEIVLGYFGASEIKSFEVDVIP